MTTSPAITLPFRRRLAVLAAAVVALAVLPAIPSAAAPVTEIYYVDTVQDARLRVEVIRDPARGAQQPVLMTYSPYHSLNDLPLADGYESYVGRGFARARVDVLGTRGSDGCWDYGGLDEQQSGLDAVEFLADQPWSNGRVIMIGGSYDGTTANMVAARGQEAADKGLVGIVPIVAISRWYGYAYSQGMRYTVQSTNASPDSQGFDTPLLFDYGFAKTVAPDPVAPNFSDVAVDRASECGGIDHTQHAYDESPDYTEFWSQRDYLKDAAQFRVPVLFGGGWQDYNVKQEETINLYNALPVDDLTTTAVEGVPFKLLFMGQNGHGNPAIAEWQKTLNSFLDHVGKGIDNGIDDLARSTPVYTVGRTGDGSGYAALPTSVEAAWPPVGTQDVTLTLGRVGDAGVVSAGPVAGSAPTAAFTDVSAGDEVRALRDRAEETDFLTYVSAPLAQDTRIAGEALLNGVLAVNRDRGSFTPILIDVEGTTARTAARGFMNLQYRNGLAKAEPLPSEPFNATAVMKPQDYTFKKGNRIGVILLASNVMWARPDLPGQTTTVHHDTGDGNGTTLTLPIVNPPASPQGLFQE